MAALVLAAVLVASPLAAPAQDAAAATCTSATTRRPPSTIRVFMSHHRGSSVRAHVSRVPFRWYVAVVMASGAWPGYLPMESLKVGAQAIKQYAWWHILHHQRGYDWHGACYDIRNGDQLYRPDPATRHYRVNRRITSAVDTMWPVRLYKSGRLFRTGWRGNAGRDGWHLFEDTVSALAARGWRWRAIVRQQLSPVVIR